MENQPVVHAEQGDRTDRQGRRANEAHRGRPQGVEKPFDLGVFPDGVENFRDQQDDDHRRGGQPNGGDDAAGDAGGDVAHVGGHVHADGTGGGLGNGDHGGQVRGGEPPRPLRQVKEEGDRGHAAAHGEQAHQEEFPV